jgi:hypothetical protein
MSSNWDITHTVGVGESIDIFCGYFSAVGNRREFRITEVSKLELIVDDENIIRLDVCVPSE